MAKKLINRGELVAYRKMLAENPDALTKKQEDKLVSIIGTAIVLSIALFIIGLVGWVETGM